MIARCVVGLGACVLVSGCFCNNECSFIERCNGNVREVCGDGVDQMVNRKVRQHPCGGPVPVCVEARPSEAVCTRDAASTCSDDYEESCEGDTRIHCQRADAVPRDATRYVVAQECGPNRKCIDDGKVARCE